MSGYDYSVQKRHGFVAIVGMTAAALASLAAQSHQVQRLPPVGSRAPVSGYAVTHVYPHDPRAFTQGIEYRDGVLFEGTGLNGESTLRKVDLTTGKVLQQIAVPREYFAEGITIWGPTIIQLTWQSQMGFVYDRSTFKQLRSFPYSGEGWGLTHNATQLIMSDGSASLRFLDPKTLMETRRLLVTDAGIVIRDLNELEWVNGEIYANVWRTNFIARISPANGRVLGWIDLSGLLSADEQRAGADVLNGIAYDATGRRLFVTGKLWPKLFEIQVSGQRAAGSRQ
jgi:glutaminyl-peptide cyclotransferase